MSTDTWILVSCLPFLFVQACLVRLFIQGHKEWLREWRWKRVAEEQRDTQDDLSKSNARLDRAEGGRT